MRLPDLVARIRIDTSELKRVGDRAAVSMKDASRRATDALSDMPERMRKVGEDSGSSLGRGAADAVPDSMAGVSEAMTRQGRRAGVGFSDGFLADMSRRLGSLRSRFAMEGRGVGAALVDGAGDGVESRSSALYARLSTIGREAGRSIGNSLERGLVPGINVSEMRLQRLGRTLMLIGAITALAGLAGQAVAFAAALAPALNIVAALPGAAAGAVAAFATVKVATSGMGDAFEAVAEGDAEKLTEALEKLSPAAREVVLAYQGIFKAFKPVQIEVQEALFAGLGQTLTDLATTAMPVVRTGMLDIAGAMNQVIRQTADVIGTSAAMANLQAIFEGTSQIITILSPAIASLAGGLLSLSAAAQPVLERFAAFVADGLTTAGVFLQSAEGAERMAGVLDRAGDALSTLFDIAVNLGRILGSVFSAADVPGFLVSVKEATAGFADFLKTAEGQANLETLFTTLRLLAANLGTVMPIVAKAILSVLDAINSLPGPLRDAVYQLAALGIVIGPLLSTIGGLSAGLRILVSGFSAFKTLAKLGPLLAGALGPVGMIIVGIIAVVVALGLVIYKNWDTIKTTTIEVFDAVNLFLAETWDAIYNKITSVIDTVVAWVTTRWNELKTATVSSYESVKNTIGGAWDWISSRVRSAVDSVRSWVENAWASVRTRTSEAFEAVKTAVSEKLGDVLSFVSQLPRRVLNALGSLASTLYNSGVDLIQGLINGVTSKINGLISAVTGVADRVKNVFKSALGIASPSKVFAGFGADIDEGLVKGLQAKMPAVSAAVRKLGKTVTGGFQAAMPEVPTRSAFETARGSYTNGGTSNSSSVVYNANFNTVPYTPEQIARESIGALKRMERRHR